MQHVFPQRLLNSFSFQNTPVENILLLLVVGWWSASLHLLILSIEGALFIIGLRRGKAAPLLIGWKEAPLVFRTELTLILVVVVLGRTSLSGSARGAPTVLVRPIRVSAALAGMLCGAVVVVEGSLCNLINGVDSASSHNSCLNETHLEKMRVLEFENRKLAEWW
jgi:hypothetical protein